MASFLLVMGARGWKERREHRYGPAVAVDRRLSVVCGLSSVVLFIFTGLEVTVPNYITAWPNGAKVAVLVTSMLETWSIGKAPAYSPMTSPLKPGVVDRLGVSWSEYGGRTGIWRFMKIFDRYEIPATVCVSGRSVDLFPEAVEALHSEGHELAGHSYTQDSFLTDLTPDEEREMIDKCFRLIDNAVGVKPVGWLSPRATPTEHTAALLAEQGCLWHGDYNDTDLPYELETPHGTIVAIPHSDFADNRVLRGSPRDFLNVYKDTFDFLYGSDSPELINLTVHAHFGGRPMISAMLVEILTYMKGFPDVWFARHDDVARWVLQNK